MSTMHTSPFLVLKEIRQSVKKIEKEINSLSRFPSENPNPIIRINDKSTITYLNKPAEVMLNQLGNDKKKKLLKHLHDLVDGRKKVKSNKSKRTEIKIGAL